MFIIKQKNVQNLVYIKHKKYRTEELINTWKQDRGKVKKCKYTTDMWFHKIICIYIEVRSTNQLTKERNSLVRESDLYGEYRLLRTCMKTRRVRPR